MKDLLFAVCLLGGLALTNSVQPSEWRAVCLKLCKCEVRPWFSPSSMYNEAPTVDCNDLGLLSLPERLPLDTQVLLSQANNIAKIDSPLDYLVNLTEVDLSRNNISSLSDVHLGHLPQLLSLHLEENWQSSLHDNCLAHFPNLQELYVNHNLLSLISAEAFQGLNKLLRLHLNSNQLRAIRTEWFRDLFQLEILMIGENPIARIQDMNFKPLINLRCLVLTRMNLTEIPDGALVGLDKLESVSFYDNMFPKVPQAALRKVLNLKFLDLNKNPIERIKRGDFVDMLHLKELGINSMPELVSIDSFAMHNLPELTKIEATNNPRLSYIHPNAFSKLPRLESLMLNSNALRALHHITVESLPNLQEVSMHTNPIYCDCVIRWINTNKTNVRFMEPDALICAGPSEFEGRLVRHVHSREMADMCLPLISPESLPDQLNVGSGDSVSLHCRAFADPEPEIYWVTPSGEKILPQMVSKKYRLHPEGTFDIYGIAENEAGQYTCVAHNLIGADMRSISVVVNGYYPLLANESLHIQVEGTEPHSVRISWVPPKGSLVSNIKWSTTSQRRSLQFTAHVLSDVKTFNLTHLHPLTQYEVCVEITDLQSRHLKNCLNVSTTEILIGKTDDGIDDGLIISITALLLIVSAMVCSFICMFQRSDHFYRKLRNQQSEILPSHTKPIWGSRAAKANDSETDLTKISI
ncbi:leucine-rich repeat neuronal protein 3 [Pimephales promelas]|uniref:leucine-rich repeat neuronal protein 3 n=1 Tax=Pimephales promelas TaxID=90988 RepID=UPI0019558E45|nr:leucine-rich repeat neuronal protein 3 [Pimephales promelas]XP_039513994.1 leucine-rich repeat neuronal protein 3 [Pimephales promelas]XP_039513995.1 leucine-rich repeat neuronal protein 3 [Pimephales promelas]